jgi:hypothetical protein
MPPVYQHLFSHDENRIDMILLRLTPANKEQESRIVFFRRFYRMENYTNYQHRLGSYSY